MTHTNQESALFSRRAPRQEQRTDLPPAQGIQILLYVGGLFGAAAFATLAIGS